MVTAKMVEVICIIVSVLSISEVIVISLALYSNNMSRAAREKYDMEDVYKRIKEED